MMYSNVETDEVRFQLSDYKYQLKNKKLILIVIIFSLIIAFFIGFLIGNSRHYKYKEPLNSYYAALIKDDTHNIELRDFLLNEIKSENIEANLKYLTSLPHTAGTEYGEKLAQYVYKEWSAQGLDYVKMLDYDVLLDYPDENKFNK